MSDKRSALHHLGTFIPYVFRSLIQKRHSPLVYALSKHLSSVGMSEAEKEQVKQYRAQWLRTDESFVAPHPYQRKEKEYRLSEIARKEGKTDHYGKLLYTLVKFFKPQRMLETGTSLGISTLYQALAMEEGSILTTIEGVQGLQERASKAFKNSNQNQVQFVAGKIDGSLSHIIDLGELFDWVFLDGDHRYESTVSVVHSLMPVMTDGGVMVLDDIRWSDGMWHAWKEISSLPCVSHAIDFHMMGLLVFKKQSEKQHFTLYW